MYADDIYLMAPTGNLMQNLLDVCHNYGIANDILFNTLKSVIFFSNLYVNLLHHINSCNPIDNIIEKMLLKVYLELIEQSYHFI